MVLECGCRYDQDRSIFSLSGLRKNTAVCFSEIMQVTVITNQLVEPKNETIKSLSLHVKTLRCPILRLTHYQQQSLVEKEMNLARVTFATGTLMFTDVFKTLTSEIFIIESSSSPFSSFCTGNTERRIVFSYCYHVVIASCCGLWSIRGIVLRYFHHVIGEGS